MTNPSPAPKAGRPPRVGLGLPRDILIAPGRAFAAIGANPEWLPAYLVIAVVGLLSVALMGPAIVSVLSSPTADGSAPAIPHEAKAAAAVSTQLLTGAALQEVFIPLLMIGLTASALTIVARLRAQTTPYLQFVSLAANCLIPTAISTLINALAVRAHEPTGFHDIRSLLLPVPDNLGIFADPHNDREVNFLARFDIFDVWSYVLLGFGVANFTQIRLTAALAIAFALDFAFALIF
jgi:hypothetical protein